MGAMGDQTCCSLLISRKCNLRMHEIRHEFLYLPDCPVALMSRDLLSKLRAQINSDCDGMAALKMRELEILTLTVVQEEEW
jgi:hypothetical protein